METPSSSTRRVTRSQALAASINGINSSSSSNNIQVSRKIEDSEKNVAKSRQRNGQQQDRSALFDITNDSPIVGLANGSNLETPSSSMVKQRGSRVKKTPGSGEALLRGQVKTLLQNVEEEAELSKLSLESRPFLQLVDSPMGLLAPTPANTPQIPNLFGDGSPKKSSTGLASVTTPTPVVEEQLISQNQENSESEKSLITRSLLLDFSEKSEVSDASECSSELTYQEALQEEGGGCYIEEPSAFTEDDDASIWSMQVNASTHDEDEDEEIAEEEEEQEEEEEDYYYEDIEEEEDEYDDDDDGGLLVNELCEGLNRISVNERVAPKFTGKHTRFVYNSDEELVEEVVEEEKCGQKSASASSTNILRLKGLPTPKGKHLRFSEEEEEEEAKSAL